MFGEWQFGTWRSKPAYSLRVNIYVAIVVRAREFNAESDWSVFVTFGNMEDTLADEQGRPVRFPRSEEEAAKAAALQHALNATSSLLVAVKECVV